MEYPEIKDRIAHIIRAKNLTAAEFAIQLGIQPSNISHLLSGRNNPSLEFVKKLKETFPEYNLEWIIFGKGPMTVSEPFREMQPMSDAQIQDSRNTEKALDMFDGTLFAPERPVDSGPVVAIPDSDAVLKRIILVYADNSFEILSPR